MAPSAMVAQKQGTTGDLDKLEREIREATKDLPPSLGESEILWADPTGDLMTMIEEILGVGKELEAWFNGRSAATTVGTIQNHPGSQNASHVQANSIRPPPYYPVIPGALGPGNGQRIRAMSQQAQTVPPPQAVVPPHQRHQSWQYIPGSNLPSRAYPNSQSVPGVRAETLSWSPRQRPTPQYPPIPSGFPAHQTYPGPPATHRSPNGARYSSFESFQHLQDRQIGGHQLTNGSHHNSGNQQNVGPQQVYGFQPISGPQENNTLAYNSRGFQQSTGPQNNGGFQQNNGFQQDHGAQQSQTSQQSNSSQSEDVSRQNVASHQENVP